MKIERMALKYNNNTILVFGILFSFITQCTAIGQGEFTQSEDGRSGSMSFKPPDLNDEEAQSQHMPDAFKCDACKIMAYQFSEHFKKVNEKYKSLQGNLAESVVLDTIETVCKYSFDDYGIKEIKGVKRLSGPGTEIAEVPGIMQGGGKWPARFHQLCDAYVGEVGEDEIYSAYQSDSLEKVLCHDKSQRLLSACEKTKSKSKKQKKPSTSDEKKKKKKKGKKEEL